MQRPRGMREKGAFGELQKVQPGWEFEGGMRLEVTEGRGGSGGEGCTKLVALETKRPNYMVFYFN